MLLLQKVISGFVLVPLWRILRLGFQGDDIITAINEINTDYKPKKEKKKKKDYGPKYNTGGNDGTTQQDVNANVNSSSSSSSYSYSNPYNNPSTENVGTSGMTYGNVSSR